MHKRAFIIAALLIILIVLVYNKKNTHAHNQATPSSVGHLAIIMDGNRRWAKKHGYKPWVGHQHGIAPLKAAVEFCIEHTIPYLTVYAFSLENFKRSPQELEYLFDVVAQELVSTELENLFKNNIKVQFLGDRTKFPPQLQQIIANVEEKSNYKIPQLTLNLLFCYGGRQELVASVKALAAKVLTGELSPADITEQHVEQHLWTAGLPNPDLIIRTGYQKRLSNFLPFQSTYSELCFLDCYWPEVTKKHLEQALHEFESIKRNYGT